MGLLQDLLSKLQGAVPNGAAQAAPRAQAQTPDPIRAIGGAGPMQSPSNSLRVLMANRMSMQPGPAMYEDEATPENYLQPGGFNLHTSRNGSFLQDASYPEQYPRLRY